VLSEEDKASIPLAEVKTRVVHATLADQGVFDDTLGLMDKLAQAVRVHEGLVFVDKHKAAGACKPIGGYTVRSGHVKVTLNLKRDGKIVGSKTVTGTDEDLDAVVSQLVAAVAEGCAIAE